MLPPVVGGVSGAGVLPASEPAGGAVGSSGAGGTGGVPASVPGSAGGVCPPCGIPGAAGVFGSVCIKNHLLSYGTKPNACLSADRVFSRLYYLICFFSYLVSSLLN